MVTIQFYHTVSRLRTLKIINMTLLQSMVIYNSVTFYIDIGHYKYQTWHGCRPWLQYNSITLYRLRTLHILNMTCLQTMVISFYDTQYRLGTTQIQTWHDYRPRSQYNIDSTLQKTNSHYKYISLNDYLTCL